jgi:HlyD family secretion protein
MQEVMSEIPGSFLKWGLFLFFGIIIAIVGVGWFISYPDVVISEVTLTTYNSPASLVARTSGTISRVFVRNEEHLSFGQPISLIGNQAEWEDIVCLNTLIDTLKKIENWERIVNGIQVPMNLSLGEIQAKYLRFVTLFGQFRVFLHQSYMPSKIDILNKQVIRQEENISALKNQLWLSQEDVRLAINSYRRDSNLFEKSNYSISITELERSKQALIQKQIGFSSLKFGIGNNESMILKLKESLLDLNIQYEKEINKFNSDLTEALQLLANSLGQWNEKYLISSPTSGKITFTGFWNVNQVIKAGDLFATVIPDDPEKMIVRAKIPVSGSGKVKKGQMVNIKLSGFPYMEFGIIKGRIISISLVPVEESYIAEIDLINGMNSTYNKEIRFINEMTGKAEIITENSKLIYRFLKPLNALN